MEKILLNNGIEMPVLGLGTFMLKDPDICEQVVLEAIRDGYRLIDTAQIFHNEKYIGRAIKNCGLDRSELFVTTKLWPSSYSGERPLREVRRMLKRLNTDYIDLLMINNPVRDWKNAWEKLEVLYREGTVRAIGVSNFNTVQSLTELNDLADIKPSVDQVECHPLHARGELKYYLDKEGIKLEAWFPLGHGNPLLIDDPVLTELSRKYRKSVQQIILRWHIQSGHVAVPRSSDPRHIRADINIFNFTLAEEDMKRIDGLDMENSFKRRIKIVEEMAFRFRR